MSHCSYNLMIELNSGTYHDSRDRNSLKIARAYRVLARVSSNRGGKKEREAGYSD